MLASPVYLLMIKSKVYCLNVDTSQSDLVCC